MEEMQVYLWQMWLRPKRQLLGFEYILYNIYFKIVSSQNQRSTSQSGIQKFVTKICMWFKVYDQYSKIYSANWQKFCLI